METIIFVVELITVVGIFAALFINNIIYIAKTRKLLKYLQEKHYEEIKDWGLPDSLLDASPKRVPKFLEFLKSPECFNDSELKGLKEKASFHLKLGYFLFGVGAVLFIAMYVLIGIHKL